ncbi:hypothetical protein [Streptomyces fradiae]|nr:hypothetical protein [Streptomyces fradiae]
MIARSHHLVKVYARGNSTAAHDLQEVAVSTLEKQASAFPGPNHEVLKPEIRWQPAFVRILILLGFFQVGRRWLSRRRRRKYQVRLNDPDWVDVGKRALILRLLLPLRIGARIYSLIVLLGIVRAISSDVEFDLPAIALGILAFQVGWVYRPPVLRTWKPHLVRGFRVSMQRPKTWIAPLISILGLVALSVGMLVAALLIVVTGFGFYESPMVIDGRFYYSRYLPEDVGFAKLLISLVLFSSPDAFFEIMALFVFGLSAACAAGFRRLARRFALNDASAQLGENSASEEGPLPVLYLRNFSDDSLKMPASVFGRTSLVERLSVSHTQTFEEILARHLNKLGPVVALNPPGTRLPRLGAAKSTRSNDSWKSQVEEWADQAAAIVVAATPQYVNCGFQWEIEYLAKNVPNTPLLLVLAPYDERDLQDRWLRFLEIATRSGRDTSVRPRFLGLQYYRSDNTAAHIMVAKPDGGWIVWGAHRRTEFSYAVAFSQAIDMVRVNLETSRSEKTEPPMST